MTKQEHNQFLYRIIAIDRLRNEGKRGLAEREILRIIAELITDVYEMQETSS